MILACGAGAMAMGGLRRRVAGEAMFTISLAQWSLHRQLSAGDLDNLDFALAARERFGIDAIEYVNGFFKDKASDDRYIERMRRRAEDAGVKSLLIMIDGEGRLGDPDTGKRGESVRRHAAWLTPARALGCHSIRVNAQSEGSRIEQGERCADGLRALCEIANGFDLNVIIENHGGLSSDGQWLSDLVRRVDHPRCGTLPDFGNFCMDWSRKDDPKAWYDRYKGVRQLMPFAKGVSAKSYDFDETGNETQIDYERMMRIVLNAGYHGHLGVEYEGSRLSEDEGVRATKKLLERVRTKIANTIDAP